MSVNGFVIHPAADLFPMMTADELQELAADIETNGLQFPIMMDCTGKILIDGRNRLEACKIAKVEPEFDKLGDGEDPLAYIASVNLMRRHITKSQQVMALAMMYPEPEKGGRGNKSAAANSPETGKFKHQRLSEARAVLRHSRSQAEAVLRGTKSLDDALATAKQEQQFQHSDEAKLARLQQIAPDLADQVNEERLTINEAVAALQAREQELRVISESGVRAAQRIVSDFCSSMGSIVLAIENGEEITFSEESIALLEESYALFFERVIRR